MVNMTWQEESFSSGLGRTQEREKGRTGFRAKAKGMIPSFGFAPQQVRKAEYRLRRRE